MNRRLLLLRMVLLACEDTSTSKPMSRETLIRLACEYGHHYKVTASEIDRILCESLQCIVFDDKKEWS